MATYPRYVAFPLREIGPQGGRPRDDVGASQDPPVVNDNAGACLPVIEGRPVDGSNPRVSRGLFRASWTNSGNWFTRLRGRTPGGIRIGAADAVQQRDCDPAKGRREPFRGCLGVADGWLVLEQDREWS